MRSVFFFFCVAALTLTAQGRRGNPPPQEIDRIATNFEGVLKKINGSKLLLEVADGNVMEITVTRKTAIFIAGKPAKLQQLTADESIQVDARRGPGAVEAVTIRQKPADMEKTTNRPLKP